MSMAMVFMDSFAHYAAAQITEKWTSGSGTITTGVAGGKALANPTVRKTFTGTYAEIVLGFRVNPSVWASGSGVGLCKIADGASDQLSLVGLPSGKIELRRGSHTGTLLATSASACPFGSWTYVVTAAKIDNAAGTARMTFNGTQQFSITGQDTQNTAAAQWDGFYFQQSGSSNLFTIADLYVKGGTGWANGDMLGDIRVVALKPRADSLIAAHSQWAPFPASPVTHYDKADEVQVNDDTDYLYTANVGDLETFLMETAPTVATYHAVQLNLMARASDAISVRNLKHAVNIASTGLDYFGSQTDGLPSGSYQDMRYIWETNPATAAAWTGAVINAAEWGGKLDA
jgi:hypothetical protein